MKGPNLLQEFLAKQTPEIQALAKRSWKNIKTGQVVLQSLYWGHEAFPGHVLHDPAKAYANLIKELDLAKKGK